MAFFYENPQIVEPYKCFFVRSLLELCTAAFGPQNLADPGPTLATHMMGHRWAGTCSCWCLR